MILRTYKVNSVDMGHHFENEKVHVIFGNRNFSRSFVESCFTGICYLQQIHSDTVVTANPTATQQADAHVTNQAGLVLAIQTADCLPILLVGEKSVGAVHAGWKGVRDGIVVNCIKKMDDLYSEPLEEIKVFIGAHIQKESFEVGQPVAEELRSIYSKFGGTQEDDVIIRHPNPEKSFVDLSAILLQQIQSTGLNSTQVESVKINTFTDGNYFSYRKDKTKDRMLSLVSLKQ